ncbi:MAG: hypothetical protein KJ773_06485 [Candidatus Thermoplasmatota archaeon]|nr:hypothetical protein [Candidatus Thermoplasmatota archaeon]
MVEAFRNFAATQNVKILSGATAADTAQPFLMFSKALEMYQKMGMKYWAERAREAFGEL